MPIEIKELQIKVDLTNNSTHGSQSATTADSGGIATGNQAGADKDALIQECVEKVLAILKDKIER